MSKKVNAKKKFTINEAFFKAPNLSPDLETKY